MFNKPSTSKDYVHIYSEDPALDRDSEAFDHDAWVGTGDLAHLPCKEGLQPIEFTLRHLTAREKHYVTDVGTKHGQASMMFWLVALALKKIEPFDVDGVPVRLVRVNDNTFFRVSDEHMEQVSAAAGGMLLAELAGRIARESFGDPT